MNEYVRLEEVIEIIEEQMKKRYCLVMGNTDRAVINVLNLIKTRIWKLDIVEAEPVRQMQKPIAETDLGKYIDTPVWFEEFGRDVEELPLLLDGIGIYYAEFKEFGEIERLDRRIDDYNYQWRCWAEKPTDEERQAAEWEK